MIKVVLAIGAGSFIGGVLRYLVSQLMTTKFPAAFPFGTLTVNILGCLLIGLFFGLGERSGISQEWKLFITTGLLGGFTTFSAFSNETVGMLRDGQIVYALLYIGGSIIIGILATLGGIMVSKVF